MKMDTREKMGQSEIMALDHIEPAKETEDPDQGRLLTDIQSVVTFNGLPKKQIEPSGKICKAPFEELDMNRISRGQTSMALELRHLVYLYGFWFFLLSYTIVLERQINTCLTGKMRSITICSLIRLNVLYGNLNQLN